MNRSKIEWTDYSINPVRGLCPMACSYCYARRIYKRFKWNSKIRYDPNVMLDTGNISKPSRIFVGSTMELFGDWVKPEWLKSIFDWIKTDIGVHTYIFLTKQPQNLIKWSPFPENCWVGVSVCNDKMFDVAVDKLEDIHAKSKFISFEPLLEKLTLSLDYAFYYSGINWLIIGAQTPYSPKTAPKLSWVQEILVAASNAGNIPVFMKNNLQPVIDHDSLWAGWKLRQEFPR